MIAKPTLHTFIAHIPSCGDSRLLVTLLVRELLGLTGIELLAYSR